jgi:hypothetical protein
MPCSWRGACRLNACGSQEMPGSPLLSALTSPTGCLLRAGSAPIAAGSCDTCNVRCCTVHKALGALQLSIVVCSSSTAEGSAAAMSSQRTES